MNSRPLYVVCVREIVIDARVREVAYYTDKSHAESHVALAQREMLRIIEFVHGIYAHAKQKYDQFGNMKPIIINNPYDQSKNDYNSVSKLYEMRYFVRESKLNDHVPNSNNFLELEGS